MDISTLTEARYQGNNLTITWVDSAGLKRKDNMSPRAQDQLLVALIAVPPARPGQTPTRQPFLAQNLRLMRANDGSLALEVTIGQQMTLQIVLPDPLPARLAELLSQDPKHWQGPQTH